MKCIVCRGTNIEKKAVDEEIKVGLNIVLVSMEILVCNTCGERYYDRSAIRKIEDLRTKLQNATLNMEEVGKVFRTQAA